MIEQTWNPSALDLFEIALRRFQLSKKAQHLALFLLTLPREVGRVTVTQRAMTRAIGLRDTKHLRTSVLTELTGPGLVEIVESGHGKRAATYSLSHLIEAVNGSGYLPITQELIFSKAQEVAAA